MIKYPLVFHVIPSAHLDPVWLWDWREGLNEGLSTCRTVLDLMDEDPNLTFIRGEAAVYQHIEQTDPETFARIRRRVKEGRWDIVGGVWVQPDTNLPMAETFARHLVRGQNYFLSRFGKRATVAWAADSFGHSAGLPEIYAAAGMKGISFTRPDESVVPTGSAAFWWEGPGGSRIMAYRPLVGWYGCGRDEVSGLFDKYLAAAQAGKLRNIGVMIGLGNHGGGPTRRQLADVRQWASKHPEVKIVFSGLHPLIDSLYEEVAQQGDDLLPTHKGELNFLFRGCYASLAKFKFAYRRTEALVERAQRTDGAICAATGKTPADLVEAWDSILFNSFHDILPGSSIERAYDEQMCWLGAAQYSAQKAESSALNALAMRVDTRVPQPPADHPCAVPLLVFNPHPFEYRGPVEMEACLDFRPLMQYERRVDHVPVQVLGPHGKPMAHQIIRTEHTAIADWPWRKRVLVDAKLPPMGWSVFSIGWVEGSKAPRLRTQISTRPDTISNGIYTVQAKRGGAGIKVSCRGKSIFSAPGLSAITVEDPWGAWGGMYPDEVVPSADLSDIRHRWKIEDVQVLEHGPQRAMMWVKLVGGSSRLELTFSLCDRRATVDVSARVLWNERSARLKLVMPAGDHAQFEVPGAVVKRAPSGEVPGGRWVRVRGKAGTFGFASDALYAFDCKKGSFRATVVRASRYGNDVKTGPADVPWLPAVDAGELKFRFVLCRGAKELPRLAAELEQPPMVQMVPVKQGAWPRIGSLMELAPASLKMLSLKAAEDANGWILRAQQMEDQAAAAHLRWQGQNIDLGQVKPWKIVTWRLSLSGKRWEACQVDIVEQPKGSTDELARKSAGDSQPAKRRSHSRGPVVHAGGHG